MAERRHGITMNGVTARMGTNQHLIRSVLAIMQEGGVKLANGDRTGLLRDPDDAAARMRPVLAVHGIGG